MIWRSQIFEFEVEFEVEVVFEVVFEVEVEVEVEVVFELPSLPPLNDTPNMSSEEKQDKQIRNSWYACSR